MKYTFCSIFYNCEDVTCENRKKFRYRRIFIDVFLKDFYSKLFIGNATRNINIPLIQNSMDKFKNILKFIWDICTCPTETERIKCNKQSCMVEILLCRNFLMKIRSNIPLQLWLNGI